jgi:hypothetical protein
MAMLEAAPERRNRAQIEEDLDEVLIKNIPQTAATIARKVGYEGPAKGRRFQIVVDALKAKSVRGEAKRVENGWVRGDSSLVSVPIPASEQVTFPYRFEVVSFDLMFVDSSYQRRLTNFVREIQNNFDPALWGTLALSDRGEGLHRDRFAIIDGQTRWEAARTIGVPDGPCIVYEGLSPQDEAEIFWKLQKNRRGVLSLARFKAQVAAGDQQAIAITRLCEMCEVPIGETGMRAVAALEVCYRRDSLQLERMLVNWHAAFPNEYPASKHIRGIHYFLSNYPINEPTRRNEADVDDERFVRRLQVAGLDGLDKNLLAVKQLQKGSSDKLMGLAVESAYNSRAQGRRMADLDSE